MSTKSQVAEIKAKGWTPIYYDGSERVEYEGMYDADAIVIPKINSIDENAPIYLASQRVESLQGKKGIFIVGGKKVLVKQPIKQKKKPRNCNELRGFYRSTHINHLKSKSLSMPKFLGFTMETLRF